MTLNRPSYWHGWSPDGKTLAYCGIRDQVFDIYTIPVEGGEETRLTFGEGRNDGPDYGHDGAWIYFNSSRSGRMQIWRVRPDGSDVTRVTDSEYGDWFPHPSPDGKHLLVLSYDGDVFDHPRDLDVRLRLMNPDGGNARVLFSLFGGQGTINVPNWSPDRHCVRVRALRAGCGPIAVLSPFVPMRFWRACLWTHPSPSPQR